VPLSWGCGSSGGDLGPAQVEQRTSLSDAAQVSELLGFSLEQVMPAGVRVATLTWNESRSGIDSSPASSTTELRWSLALPEPGSEQFRIEQVDVECDRTRFVTNLDSLCEDRLEASLLLHLESADGALAEEVPVTFDAHSPSDVSWLNTQLDFPQFAGSLAISASVGVPNSLRLGVLGSVTDGDFKGSLVSDVVTKSEQVGGGTLSDFAVVTVAEWGNSPAAPAAQK